MRQKFLRYKHKSTQIMHCIYGILFFIGLLFFTSCESLFHEEEVTIGEIETLEDLEVAVNGVYGALTNSFFNNGYYSVYYESNLKADDLNPTQGGVYKTFYLGECSGTGQSYYDNSEKISVLWEDLYRIIATANNILNQFDASSSKDNRVREMLGEIYFIRAYCYFRLKRSFGRILIVDNVDIDYNLQKSSYSEIYTFIENDLKRSVELLPLSNSAARQPYITPMKGTAKAVLAEVYLSWAGYPCNDPAKYRLAAEIAKGVIDSAAFYGLGLLDDFAFLWDQQHFYNSESVFSLYTTDAYETDDYYEASNNIYSGRYNEVGYGGSLMLNPELFVSTFFYSAEKMFFNNFPNGYRKDITFFNEIYNSNVDTGYYHFNTVTECTRPAYRKFYYDPVLRLVFWELNSQIIERNFFIGTTRAYLFRFASTLLTYAEASARAGQLNDLSYECVNWIRRRAHHLDLNFPSEYDLQPGLSTEAFADSVVWERAWELAGEPEGRWFDLVRLEMVEDLPVLRDSDEGGPPSYPVTKDDYFFPIPVEESYLNPNLTED